MNVPATSYRIIYNQKDITRDISDHLISLSYRDKVEGEADELTLELEDKDDLWKNGWYPSKGDTISADIIHGGLVLNCGSFNVDEINLASTKDGGDTVSISAIASYINKKLRTKKHTSHENKTLRQLAQFIAEQHSLTIQGMVPDIRFSRITQNFETDLGFLFRLAKMYGIIFSVRGNMLIFTLQSELEGKPHVLTVDKTECTTYSLTDKNESTYKAAKVKYHNPAKSQLIEHTENADGDYSGGADEMVIKEKVENEQQARAMSQAALMQANTRQQTGNYAVPGHPLLLSGSNVELTGFGSLSGIYHTTESTHTINRSDGYTTEVEAKRVNKIEKAKHTPKRNFNNRRNRTSNVGIGAALVGPFVNPLNLAGQAQ